MRKWIGLALAALLALGPLPAAAQYGTQMQLADGVLGDINVVSTTGATVSAGDASFTANSQSVVVDAKGIGGLSLTVTGTFTATLQVQWSNKSSSGFTAGQVRDINTGTQATSITATGNYVAPAGGRYAKITTTAYTSGTAVVTPILKGAGLASAAGGSASLPIIGNGATVAVSTPLLNLSQTWNAGGVTFTGAKLNVTDTASAAASLLLDLQVGGSSKFKVAKNGDTTAAGFITATNYISTVQAVFASSFQLGNGDVILTRDAANTLAQRNGTSAQAFNVYNTYTDASNYERLELITQAGDSVIQQNQAGTGTARGLTIGTVGLTPLTLRTNNSPRWIVQGAGSFVPDLDQSYDIGQVTLKRVRNMFLSGYIQTGAVTVANLPACSSTIKGARHFVTDANSTTFLATAAGGGANNVPVVCDGTSWKIG